jgi:hypothetical protein
VLRSSALVVFLLSERSFQMVSPEIGTAVPIVPTPVMGYDFVIESFSSAGRRRRGLCLVAVRGQKELGASAFKQ